jgi:hypothetical protein
VDRHSPIRPDHAAPSHRFVARPAPLGFKTILKFSILGLILMVADLVAMMTLPQYLTVEAVLFLVGGWVLGAGFMAYWWWYGRQRFLISVTSGHLTIDRRPGEAFSFSDARLGPWNAKVAPAFGGGRITVGDALHLKCGPHSFVLGGGGHCVEIQPRRDAPPVDKVDAWMSSSDFEELLTVLG